MKSKTAHLISSRISLREYADDIMLQRELCWFLAWRNILIKYKQTFVGIVWAIFRPFVTALIFAGIFGKITNFDQPELPYFLFVLSGMAVWQFFSTSVLEASSSLVDQPNLITKVYFPRVLLPMSVVVSNLVDFIVIALFLLVSAPVFNVPLKIFSLESVVIFPALIIYMVLITIGFSLWFSALTVRFRDVKYALPFLIQVGLFVTPILYPGRIVSEWLHYLYYLNPLVVLVEGFRFCFFGIVTQASLGYVMASSISGLVIVVSGLLYFKHIEEIMADII